MKPAELATWCRSLILKIHLITGWNMPHNELMPLLIDLVNVKLATEYDTLNPDEVEYAFMRAGTTITDYGKAINLNMIDQVLKPYLSQRLEISQAEERKNAVPVQKIYTDEEILNERRGQIEAAYQAMRRGKVPIVFDYFGEVLQQDGIIIHENGITDYFVYALNSGQENIYVK